MKYSFWSLPILFILMFQQVMADPVMAESEKAVSQALELKLDQNEQWWNLFNYRRDFFFWKRSQADSPAFFLGNNPWSPKDELVATIRGVFNPELIRKSPDNTLDERVQCFFPGRYLWLQRNLKNIQWPDVKCQRFDNFKGIMSTRSATYVFSSYYLDNPSSAYGHSFLRLNRADESKGEKKFELIDFGVGYTAVPTTGNTALYALMGVAGLFPGRFETNPYYFKVREYNDFENRDLWEYDLNFTQDEIDLLVAHIFELDSAVFAYVYFTENCAYRILAILDAVRPSLNLVKRSKIDMIPGDSLMLVAETPGFVKSLHYRPSSRAIFMARQATLNEEQKHAFHQFMRDEDVARLIKNKSEVEKQILLDTAMDYLDFMFADDVLKNKGKVVLKKEILISRSEVSLVSPVLEVPVPPRAAPSEAHGSARWSVGYLSDDSAEFMTIGHRFALHDLLDPVTGYLPGSEIEMFNFNFTWALREPQRFQLDNFHLLQIASLSPRDMLNHSLSWRVSLSLLREYQENCTKDCLPAVLSGGVGWAKEYQQILLSFWLKSSLAYNQHFINEKVLVGAGPAVLAKYYYTDRFSFLAEAWYRYDYKSVMTDFRKASIGAQFNFHKDFGIRAVWQADRQYKAEFNYYY